MNELVDHPEDTRGADDRQAGATLADLVANGSLYLWTDEGCRVGFHPDEPVDGAEQLVPLGELLDQAVYRNLPPDPRRRGAYRFDGRGMAEMRALREVLAEAMALIDRHMPPATVSRPPAGRPVEPFPAAA